jgi:hypothetical protein
MNNEIPLKYYDIADEYATECAKPVSESEREPLAHYFQLLLTRLMNNEEISEEAQAEMAREAGLPRIVSMRSRCSSISGAMSSLSRALWPG